MRDMHLPVFLMVDAFGHKFRESSRLIPMHRSHSVVSKKSVADLAIITGLGANSGMLTEPRPY